MRVALLSNDWRLTGGVARYVRGAARLLASAGHDVLVVHGGAQEAPPAGIELAAVPGALRLTASGDQAATRQVLERLERFAPDVAHFHSTNNFPLEDAVAARVPSVKTLHVHEYCPSGTKYHFARERPCTYPTGPLCLPRLGYLRCTLSARPTVWWSAYRHTTSANRHHRGFRRIVVCSDYAKQQAVASGFDPDRVSVVPLFADLPPAPEPAVSRRVLFAGRFVRSKGADLLLDALSAVPGAWQATLAGDGPEMPRLQRRVADLGWTGRVRFAGWLDDAAMHEAYRDAALVAMPSRWPEPFGLVGLEAMAHARPVVAFATGAIPEWLTDGVGGRLVAPLDTSALAHAIGDLLDRPEDAARLGQAGRDRVARDFSPDQHLHRLTSLYDRLGIH